MELDKIKKMIKLMNDNDLAELELESKDQRIRLRKKEQPLPATVVHPISHVDSLSIKGAEGEVKPKEEPKVEVDLSLVEVKAPMVGTFYRAPSPGADPFIDVGQTLEQGQVICIIEAMKLMNEIKSEIKGVVKEVLVENGAPVEFDQPLFLVKV